MYLPFFLLYISVWYFTFFCTLLPYLILFCCINQKTFFIHIYPSIQLNICCMKSRNIRLCFIASSSRTLMSYLSHLRAILYFSNNTSLFAILLQSLLILNGSFFFDESQIYLSYSTSAYHYRSLTCVK